MCPRRSSFPPLAANACLVFTKLASQLKAEKLADLAVIPIIFIAQIIVSYGAAKVVAKCFGFNRRASNFVTAMGVFGNSNSLPISLVISLSQTLQGLHWDQIPGDNDDEVAARGILYLLIFQQLGQLVRWSWGYHILLAPKDKYEEYNQETAEEGRYHAGYQDDQEAESLIRGIDSIQEMGEEAVVCSSHDQRETAHSDRPQSPTTTSDDSGVYEPAGRTPVVGNSRSSPDGGSEDDEHVSVHKKRGIAFANGVTEHNFHALSDSSLNGIMSFPRIRNTDEPDAPPGFKGLRIRASTRVHRVWASTAAYFGCLSRQVWRKLPSSVQYLLSGVRIISARVYNFLWEFMNPPLWAMLIAVLVASIPWLQSLFFQEGSFVNNSVTAAVRSSGGVAVPLILVVLGANLARNTQKQGDEVDAEEKQIGPRLLIACLISRMLLPVLIMAPLLAVVAKFVKVSILDDPIFVIVCFLLVGAPSALQLAQICQINGVYESVMGNILFQSYVIW